MLDSFFATLPCVKCKTPRNIGCGCWVTLRCSKCRVEKLTEKEASDPEGTAVVLTLCPECAGGDFSLVDYFDKDGKQLLVDACDGDGERPL